MLNVYDILLNLLDGDRVYESFEWNTKDCVEHIKKIPMIKIDTSFLEDIITSSITIDKEFLNKIHNKCEVYTNDKVSVIEYALLLTDGYKVIGCEFNKDGKVLYRSFLMLDEEDEVLDISDDLPLTNIDYKKTEINSKEDYLTRGETFRRNYLLKELKFAYKKHKYEKINYLFEEIYPSSTISIEDKYKKLVDDINFNYNDKHNELFKILKLTHHRDSTKSK